MKITFIGNIPSKKNSKVWTGKFLISSKAYREWHSENLPQLKLLKKLGSGPFRIEVLFYSGDKRSWDISNKFESIADILVDAGIIDDDNYNVIQQVGLSWIRYEKGKYMTEVYITNI